MSEIKIIGLDLDGTALAPGGYFSQKTKEVFGEAAKKGVHIVIATGRTYHSLPEDLFEMKEIEFVVSSNGAKVYRIRNKELVYENCIKPEVVCRLADLFEHEKLNVEAFTDGRAYISSSEIEDIRAGRSRRDADYVLSTRTPVASVCDFMRKHNDNIENISINYSSDAEKDRMEKILYTLDDVTVTSSFYFNNEIGGKTTSKADGLEAVMRLLNFSRDNLMACGDSMNDLAMIQHAKIGVAMQNASEELKKQADYITLTNREDGVARAIEKFVL